MRRTHPFWGIMWYNQLYTFKNVLLHVVTYTSPTGRFIIGWNVLPHQRTQQNYAYLDKSMILNECLIQQLKSRHVGLVTRTKTILPVTLRWGGYAVNNQEIWYINAVIHECESSIFRWKHMYYTCTHNMYVYYIYTIYIYYTCSIVIQYFIHGWPIIWSQSLSSIQIKHDRLVTSSTSLTGHVLSSMARPGSKYGSICLAEFYSWSVAHSMRTHDRQTPLTPLCSRFLLGESQICHPQLLAKILPRNNHHFHPSQKITISTNHPKYAWNLWNNNYIITI